MKTRHISIIILVILCSLSWSIGIIAAEYDPIVEQAQKRLIELGYNPGPADGKIGQKTVAAIKSFQNDHALQETGELNEVTKKKLGLSEAENEPAPVQLPEKDADVLPNPGNLTSFTDAKPNDTMQFRVTGKSSGGSIWGTDRYTTDSALAVVAVHAGVLKDSETGIVKVTFVPGQDKYEGTSKNGVTSSAWGSYNISYQVKLVKLEVAAPKAETTAQGETVLPDPGNLVSFTGVKPGDSMFFKVTGKASDGSVWGTDNYTTDSALAVVAVHAGVLKDGEEGIVKVTFAPGQDKYEGTSKNGVTTSSWGSYEISYTVEAVTP